MNLARFTQKRGKMKDNKGFTLLELVIVVIIMGIVAALAIPNFQAYAINRGLKSAARDIESDIQNLKARAGSVSRDYRMVINVGNNEYSVQRLEDPNWVNPPWNNAPIDNYPSPKKPSTFGADIVITGTTYGGDMVTFSPRGITNAGTINLRNSRGSTATIETNLTGRAHVEFSLQ
jgi:type IV pilus assembly protein PilA